MTSKPPQQAPPAPPVSVTGADAAQETAAAKAAARKQFDWSKSILRPGGMSQLPPGIRQTTA